MYYNKTSLIKCESWTAFIMYVHLLLLFHFILITTKNIVPYTYTGEMPLEPNKSVT